MSAPRYFQMLVSPHVGGGAKLAMQLHAHTVGARGPISHLLLPGGETRRRVGTGGGQMGVHLPELLTGRHGVPYEYAVHGL